MRRNWPFFKDSDWLILVFVHSVKPTAELENPAMSPSLSSPGLSYDTKFVHICWELRSSLVGDTILGVQSEPACNSRQYATARATVDPTVCAIPGTRQDTAARATADKKACVQHQSLEGLNSCDNSSRCRHRHQEARRTHQHDAGADRLISDQTCPGHRCEKYAAQVGKLFRCSRPKNETKAVGKQNKLSLIHI